MAECEIEITITPLDEELEPIIHKMVTRSATSTADVNKLMAIAADFLHKLPEADNHTSWG